MLKRLSRNGETGPGLAGKGLAWSRAPATVIGACF
jgi:hypothetical protein